MLEYLNSYIFFTCIALFGYNYVLNRNANTNAFMEKGVKLYYFLNEFFKYYNHSLYPDYFEYHIGLLEGSCPDTANTADTSNTANPPEEKYETKYLTTIRAFQNDWEFDEQDTKDMTIMKEKIYEETRAKTHLQTIAILKEISKLENQLNDETIEYIKKEVYNDDGESEYDEQKYEELCEDILNERKELIHDDIQSLHKEYTKLLDTINTEKGLIELKQKAEQEAHQHFVNQKTDKLMNCFIMETTPIGNVLMNYDKKTETFKYYSDYNVPYRYLETIARKFVITFHCKPLYIDMEEELKLFEEKWEKKQQSNTETLPNTETVSNTEALPNTETVSNTETITNKKNVFAKFKSYNKKADPSLKNVQSKNNDNNTNNNINIHQVKKEKENQKAKLKENANRYTHGGKFANFSFLKKADKTVYNKKLAFSYADFKKAQNLPKLTIDTNV